MWYFQWLGCQLGAMFWTDTSKFGFVLHGARENSGTNVEMTRERERERETGRQTVTESDRKRGERREVRGEVEKTE